MTTQRIVLVTGGTSGIGLGLAQRYAAAGARVVVAARPSSRLDELPDLVPGAGAVGADLATPEGREEVADAVLTRFGRLDVLVNNAGIQRRRGVAEDDASWPERQREIDLLFAAPVHLATLLLPVLRSAAGGQVVNVTSGGAFTPQPFAPVYSAMKAALHSWTVTLRDALAETSVAVTELIPPAVATGLAGSAAPHGLGLDEFCDAVFPGIEERRAEVGAGATATEGFRDLLAEGARRFAASASRFPVQRFAPHGAGS
ncbi:MAG: hypothetical protein K0S37_3732 [Microbacterium sp.]|jgi:uncharacterized oxidoreductase|nr:hypothetical protein [Microbacterium sp.]